MEKELEELPNIPLLKTIALSTLLSSSSTTLPSSPLPPLIATTAKSHKRGILNTIARDEREEEEVKVCSRNGRVIRPTRKVVSSTKSTGKCEPSLTSTSFVS